MSVSLRVSGVTACVSLAVTEAVFSKPCAFVEFAVDRDPRDPGG